MKKEWINRALGKGWDVGPAGGASGEAYIAQQEDTKLFIKLNASPFLAVLSAEGIVPKLIWTKRIENGDVISAQQWLEGNKLKPEEMRSKEVALLLKKLHTSSDLFDLFRRIQQEILLPIELLKNIENYGKIGQLDHPTFVKAYEYLVTHLPVVNKEDLVVCHGDLSHHNWIRGHNGQLYLIDWDNAYIADAALDLSMLLHWYVPKDSRKEWLELYGVEDNQALQQRIIWYGIAQAMSMHQWFSSKKNEGEAHRYLLQLQYLLHEYQIS